MPLHPGEGLLGPWSSVFTLVATWVTTQRNAAHRSNQPPWTVAWETEQIAFSLQNLAIAANITLTNIRFCGPLELGQGWRIDTSIVQSEASNYPAFSFLHFNPSPWNLHLVWIHIKTCPWIIFIRSAFIYFYILLYLCIYVFILVIILLYVFIFVYLAQGQSCSRTKSKSYPCFKSMLWNLEYCLKTFSLDSHCHNSSEAMDVSS